jgi:uncharacterized protein (DUF4213/DUF364 family)
MAGDGAGEGEEGSKMKIIDDVLSTLDFEAPVKDISMGAFQTAVLTRYCGLAATPHEPGPHHDHSPVESAGQLLDRGTRALADMANSASELEAAIGMATINSLLEVDESRCTELNAGELLVKKGEGKQVAIIGHFPFVPRLHKVVKELWVIEKSPREGDLPESEAEKIIPQAHVVGITGTAFTNHTIDHLLTLCNPNTYVVVLGGTTPLSPVLFDHGIDAVSGTKVLDSETVRRCVSQGATFRQIKGIRLLTMKKEGN